MPNTNVDLRNQGKVVQSVAATAPSDVPRLDQVEALDAAVLAAAEAYADGVIGGGVGAFVQLSGDTMTGALVIDPSTAGVIPLTVAANPSNNTNLTDWRNASNTLLAHVNASGEATFVQVTATTSAPSAASHLTRKDYVDGLFTAHGAAADPHPGYLTPAEANASYLQLSGGTLTGNLITITPTANGHAANKLYVDTVMTTHTSALDPHSQYLTEAEGDARYFTIGGGPAAANLHLNTTDTYSSLTDNSVPLVLGTFAADNLVLDQDKIQARTNNLANDLILQPYGGKLVVSASESNFDNVVTVDGAFFFQQDAVPSGNTLIDQMRVTNDDSTRIFTILPRPDSINDTASQITYNFDTSVWAFAGTVQVPAPVNANDVARLADVTGAVGAYLPLTGGTLSGHVSGITPTSAAHLTRKDYTDGLITTHEAAGDPHPQYLTSVEADALFLTPAEGDSAYVNVSGDTMTGNLSINNANTTQLTIVNNLVAGSPWAKPFILTRPTAGNGDKIQFAFGKALTTDQMAEYTFHNFTDPATNYVTMGLYGKPEIIKMTKTDVSFPGTTVTVPDATADGHALNRITADGRYVNITGDTMTGTLVVPTINGAGAGSSLAINGSWLPFTDGGNYFNVGAGGTFHRFRSSAGAEWASITGAGVTTPFDVDAVGEIRSGYRFIVDGGTELLPLAYSANGSVRNTTFGTNVAPAATPLLFPNDVVYSDWSAYKLPSAVEYSNDGTSWTPLSAEAFRGMTAYQNAWSYQVDYKYLRITFDMATFTFISLIVAKFNRSSLAQQVKMTVRQLDASSAILTTSGPTATSNPYDGCVFAQTIQSYNGTTAKIQVEFENTTWISTEYMTIASLGLYISKANWQGTGPQSKLPYSWDQYGTLTVKPKATTRQAMVFRPFDATLVDITQWFNNAGTKIAYVDSDGTISGVQHKSSAAAPTTIDHLTRKDYVDGVMTTHLAAGDPHPQYLTPAEGDAVYLPLAGGTITGGLTVNGAVTVGGNLTVNGTTTTVNSTTVTIDDPIFTLGGDTDAVSNDGKDRGIEFRYYDVASRRGFMGWDNSLGKFVLLTSATNTSEVFTGTKAELDASVDWSNILSKPDPVITLGGDLTGSVTLTDLGSGTLTATIAANSVDLGTDTTGNYVATITGTANRVTVTGSGSETAAVTLNLPQDIHTAATPTFSRLTLSQSIGVAPMTITSTTLVANLNADLLDGQQGSWYQDWTNITNKPDPVITLGGDATGSLTMTDLAGGTLTVTVLDDSHTHDTRYYTETEVNSLQSAQDTALQTYADTAASTAVSAHTSNGTGAHAATAISFTPPIAPPLNLFLTSTNVQGAISQVASEIDGRISAGDTQAIIDALNAWTLGDPQINASDVFSAGVIVTDALAAGAVVASKITAGVINTSHMTAGTIDADRLDVESTLTIGSDIGYIELVGTDTDTTTLIRSSGVIAYNSGTGFLMDATGKLFLGNSAGNKLTFDGANLTIIGGGSFSGDLDAAGGTFEGDLTVGTGTFKFLVRGGATTSIGITDQTSPIYNNTNTSLFADSTGKFSLKQALVFDGTNLTLTGAISGGTIDIGGADATSFHVDATGQMWLGDALYASAPFKVSAGGAVAATSGTIGGWTLGATTLTGANMVLTNTGNLAAGTGNNIVRLSGDDATYRLWAGHATAASAPFSVTSAGVLNATGATISGSVTATSGAIGGWTLGATTLTGGSMVLTNTGNIVAGTVNDVVRISADDATYRLWIGNATAASAPFRVTKAGVLTATGATITGTVTATAGAIGGWTLGATTLTGGNMVLTSTGNLAAGTVNNIVRISADDATYRLWVGHATAASAPFSVTALGALTATAGAVGGWTLGSSTLTGGSLVLTNTGNLAAGTVNDIVRISADDATYRLWIGHATAASAPFRVTKAGVLTATGATISGSVTATSGAIGGWTLAATTLTGGSMVLTNTGNLVAGTVNDVVRLSADDATYRLWIGHATAASAPFQVTKTGVLTATGATISGSVTATTGAIGGWTLGATTITGGSMVLTNTGNLTAGTVNDVIRISADDATYRLWIGNSTSTSAPFRVTKAGVLTATSATITGTVTATAGAIGGWTIGATTLTGTNLVLTNTGNLAAGTGNNVVRISADDATYRLWAGNATAASAPFSVSQTGALVATNATITGTVTATAGSIAGWTLGSTTLTAPSSKIVLTADANAKIVVGETASQQIQMLTSGGPALSIGQATVGYNLAGIYFDVNGGTPRFSLGVDDFKWDGTTLSIGTDLTYNGGTGVLSIDGGVLEAGTVTASKLVVTVGGGNVYPNSSFEATTPLPVIQANPGTYASATRVATAGIDGSYAMQLTYVADGGTTSGHHYSLVYNHVFPSGDERGRPWTFSVWVKPSHANQDAYIRIVGAYAGVVQYSGALDVAQTFSNLPVGVWTRISLTNTIADLGTAVTGVHIRYGWLGSGSALVTETMLVDAAQLQQGDVATNYSPKVDEILPGTIIGDQLNATTTITAGTGTYKVKAIGGAGTATYLGITSAATPAYNNVNTPFYAGADQQVSIADKLLFTGGNLTINGGGTFTGALSGGTISIGSANNIFKADSNGIYLGNATFASAPFRVTPAGVLTSTSGTIGGWTLGATTLTGGSLVLTNTGNLAAGTANNIVRISADDATYRLWAGHATAASAPFRVTTAGALTATSATITGTITSAAATITGGTISSGTYSYTSGNYSTQGLQIGMGSEGYIRAKNFAIDGTGNAFFKGNGEFTGTITASAGSIGAVDIGALTGGQGTTGMYVGTGVWNNAATPFYIDDAGDFSLGSKLRYDASASLLYINGDAIVNGTLSGTAITAGTLSGESIVANTKIKIGSGSTYVTVQGDSAPSNTAITVADHQDYSFMLDATQYLEIAAANTPTITTPLSIVVHVALDSWKTAATQVLASSIDTGINGGYELGVTSSGFLQIATSDGVALVNTTGTTDISTMFTDKRAYWIRADFTPDTSGNRVASYYWAESQKEEPGRNDWTLIVGSGISTATTIADPTGANGFRVGRRANTASPKEAPGRYYRTIVREGVGTGALWFNNTTAATLEASSIPDAANLTPTDDYAMRLKFRVSPPGTWVGSATNITLAGQWTTTGNQRSWKITMDELTGEIAYYVSLDGTAAKTHKVASVFYDQDEVITIDGSVQIAYTLVVGAGTYSSPAMFISYDDGKSWKQGAWFTPSPAVSPAAYLLPYNSTSPLYLGDVDDAGGAEIGIGSADGIIYEFDLYTATPFVLYAQNNSFWTINPYYWYLGNVANPPSPVLSMREDSFPTSSVTSFTINTGQTLTVGTGVVVNPRPNTLIEIGSGDRPSTDTSTTFTSTTSQTVTIVNTPDIYTGSYRSTASPLYSDGEGQFSVGDSMWYDEVDGLSVKGNLTGTGFVLQRPDGSPQARLVSRPAPNDANPNFRTYDSIDFPTPTTNIGDSSLFWENEFSIHSMGPISRFGLMGGIPKYVTGQPNVAPSVEVIPAHDESKGYTTASLISGGKPLSSGEATISATSYGSSLSTGPYAGQGQNRQGKVTFGVTGYNASSQYITGFVTIAAGGTDSSAVAQKSILNAEVGSARVNGVEISIVGEIRMWAGSKTGATLPSGWMFCAGQALSSTEYPALYAVIGTKYGSGTDGYYNFSLPVGNSNHIPQGISANTNTRNTSVSSGNNSVSHSHGVSINTGNVSADHSHGFSINTGNVSAWHTHNYFSGNAAKATSDPNANHYHYAGGNTGGISANHTHLVSGNSGNQSANHTHALNSLQIAYIINVGVATI